MITFALSFGIIGLAILGLAFAVSRHGSCGIGCGSASGCLGCPKRRGRRR